MKKVVAFLLALIIFVAPVTTLVKADVVIGDNDETIINENATILGRKLALMESLSDLSLSGVTDFTISNTNDVDSYLDYLWNEVNDAIDSLSDGTGFTEISNTLKSKYFTNLVQYKDYIINRGNYFAQLLPSGSPATNLLSTFFADNILGKQTTQHYDLALDMFRALSDVRNHENPNPPNEYLSLIELINGNSNGYGFFWSNYPNAIYRNDTWNIYYYRPLNTYSWYGSNFQYIVPNSNNSNGALCCDILTLNINTINDNTVIGNISGIDNFGYYYQRISSPTDIQGPILNSSISFQSGSAIESYVNYGFSSSHSYTDTSIYNVLSHFAQIFRNININVNGDPWAIVSNSNNSPILDIDGFIKIYGNNNPIQYELQPGTKIDYDELYTTIYNAIRDNLPISQGDINYYDSHDTIYSPTIINNYGEEEGDESDLIDTILDYAVIPKFDTAIAQPMRQALTNGVVIMQNSINNVIPIEILLILGACFFLLLFAVIINRMIK